MLRPQSTNLPAWTPTVKATLLGSPGRNGPPPATPPHRGWIVAKNVATLTKAIGLLLGVATLAVLAAVIIAGTIIGLGLLVIG
jgi:hypothetical protein